MTPFSHEKIEALFEEARLLSAYDRGPFLDDACPDDALRAEVASLLAAYDRAPAYFDSLAGDILPSAVWQAARHAFDAGNGADLLLGRRVSHYHIQEKLGGGGMGVVYKAEDTKLGRTVALKFLPPHLHADADAKERFILEAKAASALDHPDIATIHEIGETEDGRLYIAMAYYDGETLKKKIAGGPLPRDEALGYAVQIALGLEAAHRRGIVHRDVKPANVMVTETGLVKLVDFGIAKMADVQLTQTGTRIGTVSYMSPEQARGQPIDHRTDIWSLGVVLYEMLTGERPFKGDYPDAILYSVLHEPPVPLAARNADVPTDVERIIGRCLEKDKAARYPNMAALLADLEVWTKQAPTPPASTLRTVLIVAASVLLTLTLLLTIAPVREEVAKVLGLGALPNQQRVVVLPLISAEADSAFTVGLVESLTGKLKRLQNEEPSLWVESSQEVRKSAVMTPTDAFKKFGVNLALLVTATREEDTTRVILDLVDTQTLKSRKNMTIAHPATAHSALTKTLTETLASMLDVDLTPAMRNVLTAGGTSTLEAEDFYMVGLSNLQDYQETKNIDIAIQLFEQAIRKDSTYALAYASLGEAYWRKFEATKDVQWAEQAEQHCERALELDELISTTVYVTLGFIYLGKGLPGFAKGAFELALVKEPSNADVYSGIAKAYEDLNRIDDAEGAYRKAIELKRDYWAGYNALGVFYYRHGRLQEATEQFQYVVDLTPLNASGYRNLGGLYFYLERWQEAIATFELGLQKSGPNYGIYSNLATNYFYEGRYAQAAETYEKALALQDSDYRIWGYLATSYDLMPGQQEKARAASRIAIERAENMLSVNPHDPEVLSDLAVYHAKTDQPEQAKFYLDQVILLKPGRAGTLFTIAKTYEKLGDREQAIRWIEKALEAGFPRTQVDLTPWTAALRNDERFRQLLE